ncbi:DNA-binding transcriptional MerR regulator [Arthrobacter sp. UYP6]|uniref:MerR family transcriptional regulator n=1 Tax=Arthrobacter sp. UYP6 TaxID=1756378 RepID=UPI00339B1EA7
MKEAYLSSGAFANFCGTTKETLRHYDHLDLLKPKHIGDNGYHYYEAVQFYEYYTINLMRMTGTPLTKIKTYLDNQHVPSILQLLENQQQELLEQKRAIENMQFLVRNSIRNLELGIKAGNSSLSTDIAYFEKEHLLVVPSDEFLSSVEGTKEEDVALIAVLQKFKDVCEAQGGVRTDYQLGAIRPLQNSRISGLYMRVAKPFKSPYYRLKPAGKYIYVVLKMNWDSTEAYRVLEKSIEQQGIRTISDIYAYDLAGFMINGIKENNMTIVSVQIEDDNI